MVKSVVTAAEHEERVRESAQKLERLRAERERLEDEIASWEEWHEGRKAAAVKSGILEAGLTRKTMTPKQKSEVIQELGSEGYLALPWD
jgi:septal ring factor EnvC (AmiA/AmiB activator)